uniref:G_PROTEIN_RECEP_F1_2 domain-containing protein n=1 Tax=Steinernema glaseri TaxID=37863 RepID=A0A1I7YP19_9BILA
MAEADAHLSLSILRLVVFVVATSGNGLILFVVLRSRRLRKSSSNLLLAQLAFSDLFLGLSAGTRGISNIIFGHLGMTSYDKAVCLYLGFPTNFGIHLSQTTVLAISLDRFLCVKFPVLFRKMESVKVAVIRFFICLAYSMLGTGCIYVGVELDDKKIPVCSSGAVMTQWYSTYFVIFSTVFSMLIYAFYATIYILFKRLSHNTVGNAQQNLFVTMTAILVSYFLLFGLPTSILTVLKLMNAPSLIRNYMSAFTSFLSTLTSVANIFIYGWKHQEVRNHTKAMLGMAKVTMVEPITIGSRRTTKTREVYTEALLGSWLQVRALCVQKNVSWESVRRRAVRTFSATDYCPP